MRWTHDVINTIPGLGQQRNPEAPTTATNVSQPRFDQSDSRCHRKSNGEIDLLSGVDVVSEEREQRIGATGCQTWCHRRRQTQVNVSMLFRRDKAFRTCGERLAQTCE